MVHLWQAASGNTSAMAPVMVATLSSVTSRTPESPRPFSHERNSRQHSADSVSPSAAPITSQ